MAKNKINHLSEFKDFVFSTNKSYTSEESQDQRETLKPEDQTLEAVFSKKGRKGKVVTIIKGFVGSDYDLKTLAKYLKKQCSVGGSVKDGEIFIQGDYRDKIIEILKKNHYRVKKVGG